VACRNLGVFLDTKLATVLFTVLFVQTDEVAHNLIVDKWLEAVSFLEPGTAVLLALAPAGGPFARFPDTFKWGFAHVVARRLFGKFVLSRSRAVLDSSQKGVVFFCGMALLTFETSSIKAPSRRDALLLVRVVVKPLLAPVHAFRRAAVALPHGTLVDFVFATQFRFVRFTELVARMVRRIGAEIRDISVLCIIPGVSLILAVLSLASVPVCLRKAIIFCGRD